MKTDLRLLWRDDFVPTGEKLRYVSSVTGGGGFAGKIPMQGTQLSPPPTQQIPAPPTQQVPQPPSQQLPPPSQQLPTTLPPKQYPPVPPIQQDPVDPPAMQLPPGKVGPGTEPPNVPPPPTGGGPMPDPPMTPELQAALNHANQVLQTITQHPEMSVADKLTLLRQVIAELTPFVQQQASGAVPPPPGVG